MEETIFNLIKLAYLNYKIKIILIDSIFIKIKQSKYLYVPTT